jgi:hypothetical protein
MACVIVAQEFAGDFRYALQRRRPLNCNLWRLFTWRGPNAPIVLGEEYAASILPRSLEDVVQAAHIEPPGGLRFSFGSGRQHRGEVVDRSNIVPVDRIQDCVGIGAIKPLVSDYVCRATRWSP